MNYTQLNNKERSLIDYLLNKEQKSISQIAKILNRNKSTISRELRRNKISEVYDSNDAIFKARIVEIAKHNFKIKQYQTFLDYFYQKFDCQFFGVASCLYTAKQQGIKTPTLKTLYNWINLHAIKITPKHLLRPWKRKYFKKIYSTYLSKIPKDIIPITYRSTKINERQRYGDYEIDLVNSKQGCKTALLTLVDRKTRYGHVIKTESKQMLHINQKLIELIKRDNIKIKSITKDNGPEFNALNEVTKPLNIKLYTCNPYASCERGTNENFNGLIRRAFPKGTNFDKIENIQINNIIQKISEMPRRLFNYLLAKSLFEALS